MPESVLDYPGPPRVEPCSKRIRVVQGGAVIADFDLVGGGSRVERGAWTYPRLLPRFEAIAGAVAFYPGAMDECTVDGERVEAQEGGFYGGWIASDVAGPFKGGPRTSGW